MAWDLGGDGQRAAAALTEAVPLLQMTRVAGFTAWVQADVADKLVWLGDLDAAIPMLDKAIEDLRAAGYSWGVAMALGQRGHAALRQGILEDAARLFASSIAAARQGGDERAALGAAAGLAGVALACDEPERAARLLGAIDAARESLGTGRIAHGLHAERISADTRAALGTAPFEQAWLGGRMLTLEEAITEALTIGDEVATVPRG
jgi:hypothetical protein